MYSITPHLTNNYSTLEELNNLIEAIDSSIVRIGIVALNNYRFGFDEHVDIQKYKDLLRYRNILTKKLLGCNCFDDLLLLDIVSKLKKLTK